MNDKKITSEELCKALRCSASVPPKGTDILTYCKGCPYNKNGLFRWCDVDMMGMAAAERIEELEKYSKHACELIYSMGVERSKLEKRVLTLVRAMQFTPLQGELCRNCKYEERQPGEEPCEDCEGLHFEWKE